jgi:hypothetical protein
MQRFDSSNTSNGIHMEAERNYQRLSNLHETTSVQSSYDQAFQKIRQTVTSCSVPCTWTLPDQNPPCQSPRNMTIDQLYAQAEAAKHPFFRLLQALEELINAEQRQDGPLELKGIERAADKIERDYGGDASRLIDIVRGSIICRGFDEMKVIIAFLLKPEARRDYNDAYIVRIKSGFAEKYAVKTFGYRDVKVSHNDAIYA